MHEFSAACSIVDAAVEAAKSHKIKKVTAVNIEIGEFTFLVPDQLEFNFEIASKNTPLEGAILNITKTKGRVKCQECGYEGETQDTPDIPPMVAIFTVMQCPKCSSSSTVITGGKEFIITNIEVEMAET